jgi:hypothetical protein
MESWIWVWIIALLFFLLATGMFAAYFKVKDPEAKKNYVISGIVFFGLGLLFILLDWLELSPEAKCLAALKGGKRAALYAKETGVAA